MQAIPRLQDLPPADRANLAGIMVALVQQGAQHAIQMRAEADAAAAEQRAIRQAEAEVARERLAKVALALAAHPLLTVAFEVVAALSGAGRPTSEISALLDAMAGEELERVSASDAQMALAMLNAGLAPREIAQRLTTSWRAN